MEGALNSVLELNSYTKGVARGGPRRAEGPASLSLGVSVQGNLRPTVYPRAVVDAKRVKVQSKASGMHYLTLQHRDVETFGRIKRLLGFDLLTLGKMYIF